MAVFDGKRKYTMNMQKVNLRLRPLLKLKHPIGYDNWIRHRCWTEGNGDCSCCCANRRWCQNACRAKGQHELHRPWKTGRIIESSFLHFLFFSLIGLKFKLTYAGCYCLSTTRVPDSFLMCSRCLHSRNGRQRRQFCPLPRHFLHPHCCCSVPVFESPRC